MGEEKDLLLLRTDLFSKGFLVQGSKQEVIKVLSLEMAEKHKGIPIHLKKLYTYINLRKYSNCIKVLIANKTFS